MAGSGGSVAPEAVLEALGKVQDPELHRDLVSLGMIRDVVVDSGKVSFTLALTTMACPLKGKIQDDAKAAVTAIPGVSDVEIKLTADTPRFKSAKTGKRVGDIVLQDLLPTVRNVIAVASGKGGVGKSTVSTNVALSLAKDGARVGLMDADVYGPSIPTMMGINEQPDVTGDDKIIPVQQYGIEMMSIGFLIPEEQSVIWRGPMVAKLIQQFLDDVKWGELDYLIIDLPPGTGDTQLTLTQNVPLAGGLIVSTPQAVALADVRRAVAMFQKVDVPILGVVENMSTYICPKLRPRGAHLRPRRSGGGSGEVGRALPGRDPHRRHDPQGRATQACPSSRRSPTRRCESFRKLARDVAAKVSVSNLAERRAERGGDAKDLPMV